MNKIKGMMASRCIFREPKGKGISQGMHLPIQKNFCRNEPMPAWDTKRAVTCMDSLCMAKAAFTHKRVHHAYAKTAAQSD